MKKDNLEHNFNKWITLDAKLAHKIKANADKGYDMMVEADALSKWLDNHGTDIPESSLHSFNKRVVQLIEISHKCKGNSMDLLRKEFPVLISKASVSHFNKDFTKVVFFQHEVDAKNFKLNKRMLETASELPKDSKLPDMLTKQIKDVFEDLPDGESIATKMMEDIDKVRDGADVDELAEENAEAILEAIKIDANRKAEA